MTNNDVRTEPKESGLAGVPTLPAVNVEPTNRPPSQKFPRTSRLTKHAEFARAYKAGRKVFSSLMTVFYHDSVDAGAAAKVGFTVSKAFGGAVNRNRMKRRLRAAARQHLTVLPAGVEVIIHPKKVATDVDLIKISAEIERAFTSISSTKKGKR